MTKMVNIYYAGFIHRGGGAYIHVVNLSKGLKELGYELNIITLDKLPVLFRYLPHIAQKIGNFINFPFGYIYKQKIIKFFYKIKFKDKGDINIFEDIYIAWNSKIRSIAILHALWSDNLQAFDLKKSQRESLEKIETQIINRINFNIATVSRPYKNFIEKRLKKENLKKELDVIELGVDISKFHSERPVSYTHLTLPTIYSV